MSSYIWLNFACISSNFCCQLSFSSLSGKFSSSKTLSFSLRIKASLFFISSYNSFSFCFKLWIFSDFNLLFSNNSLLRSSHSLLSLIASFIIVTCFKICAFSWRALLRSLWRLSTYGSCLISLFFNSCFALFNSSKFIPSSVSNSDF